MSIKEELKRTLKTALASRLSEWAVAQELGQFQRSLAEALFETVDVVFAAIPEEGAMRVCTQKGCGEMAVSSCLWLTGEMVYSCEDHDKQLKALCQHMGWAVQFNDLKGE